MNWWKSWRLKRLAKLFSESRYDDVRERIVRNLKPDADSVPLLVVALEDLAPGISSMAAKKLGDIGDSRAIGPLLAALGNSDAGRYQTAAEALSAINPTWRESPDARTAIANSVSKLRNTDIGSETAARLLGRLRETSAEGVLLEALRVPTLRASVAQALGELRTPAAVEPLNQILNEAADQLRIHVFRDEAYKLGAVANALGKIGDRRSIGPLTRIKEILESKIGELRAAEEASDIFGGRRFQASVGGFEADVAGIASEAARRLEETARFARDERFECEHFLAKVGEALRSLDD
jgi:HEAT repeat protein